MATELRPHKLFVYAEGLLTHLRMESRLLHTSVYTRTKRDATAQYDDDDENSVLQCISCCSPQEHCSYSGKEPYQLLYLENVAIIINNRYYGD